MSHDRHFLNKVSTHTADIDYQKVQLYTGNYDFWRAASDMALRLPAREERKERESGSRAQGVHRPLQRQRVKITTGHCTQEDAGAARRRGDRTLVPEVPSHCLRWRTGTQQGGADPHRCVKGCRQAPDVRRRHPNDRQWRTCRGGLAQLRGHIDVSGCGGRRAGARHWTRALG